jgi:hypothetical protein
MSVLNLEIEAEITSDSNSLNVSSCRHLCWLQQAGVSTIASGNAQVTTFNLAYDEDREILISWAGHIRKHYCKDEEIDILRSGTKLSRAEFLRNMKLPTASDGFGPATRAGDFGEILIADYLEFQLGYWVPRTRYDRKTIKNESTKGSDVVAFMFNENGISTEDILVIFEVKSQFSGTSPLSRLQDAVDDSTKDEIRKGESLNAIKQRLLDQNRVDEMKRVERFQDCVENPYTEQPGAAALFSTAVYDPEKVELTNINAHPLKDQLQLLVVYGNEMMTLVHRLYELAADEA